MIGVYLSNKSGKHTHSDESLRNLVEEIVREEESHFNTHKKLLDVVIFDEPGWLEHFLPNKVATYSYKAISNLGNSRALLGLRKIYITKVLCKNKERIRSLIKHELVHIHIDPNSKLREHAHGKKFQEHAKKIGLTDSHKDPESYVNDRLWKQLGNK